MPLTGYLKIEGLDGESTVENHEDEIEVFGMSWAVQQTASSQVGRGRLRARADMAPLELQKFLDASSPYLAAACAQGKSYREAVLSLHKDSGEAHLDYLVITMENVVVTSYEITSGETDDPDSRPTESVAFDFEEVTIKYTQTQGDISAGDEHEVVIRG